MSQDCQRPTVGDGDGTQQADPHWSTLSEPSPQDGDGSPRQPCRRSDPASPVEYPLSKSSSPEFDGSYDTDSYCHELTLPLRISPAPSEPYMLRLCIHPDFIPVPDGMVHLARDSAFVSHTTSLHEPALVHINYELVDLWANAQRSTSPSSRSSPEPPPEGAMEHLPNPVDQIPHLDWPVFACLIALFAILIASFASQGHPAWVLTSSTNQTAEYLVWQPIHMLYRDYEEPLLPLIMPVEHVDNPLLPLEPYRLIAALNYELDEVSYQVAAWEGSSLPGPENDLIDRINHCLRRFEVLQFFYRDLFRVTSILVKAQSAVTLARAINQATSDHQMRRSIKAFWQLEEGWNRHALDSLWPIKRQLRAIRNETECIFAEVDQALRPHIDGRWASWTRDAIDAIDFSREYILPLLEWTAKVLDRAITKLSSLDSRLSLQASYWKNMTGSPDILQKITCHHETGSQQSYNLGWVLSCEAVTTHWVLDNRTIEELGNVGNRGAEMGKFIKIDPNPNWSYDKLRPLRPSDRGKR
ncbi:hypothetical protein NW759_006763 [Fusarium solani]|nr:hypothetical protein NW759_006763 [Fusarium solani]